MPFQIDGRGDMNAFVLTSPLAGVMLLTRRQPFYPSAAHDKFFSICTAFGGYTEFGIVPERPNQKWATDVTEFSLFGRKLYLSPILDLHNGYLVSYTISERPVLSMVTSMLGKAFETIPDGTELILHSDQGWHYQHKQYQHMLKSKGIRQSMSRKGNCLDNAVMENFFGLLKSELLYLQTFQSMENFKQELIHYLDYYNNHRIKIKLKGLPPALHRQQALSAA